MNRKKLIHVMQIVGAPVGGIRKHVHTIVNELDPNVFQQSYAYAEQTSDKVFQCEYDLIRQKAQLVPLTIVKKPAVSDLFNILRLHQYIIKNGVDIVHGHGAKGGLYARVLAHWCGIKAVYTPHGGSVHQMFSAVAQKLYAVIEKQLMPWTDYLVFESEYTKTAYLEIVKQLTVKWQVNHNGVYPLDRQKIAQQAQALDYTDTKPRPLRIGVFGVLRKEKGQSIALQALAQLLKMGHIAQLHFFGDGANRESLEQTANSLVLSRVVQFHGEVTEVEPHIYAMDIILIPSLFESFGYVAVEALQLGKPVIASAVGGLCEIITANSNAMLVPPNQPTVIAQTLADFINNDYSFKKEKLETITEVEKRFSVIEMMNSLSEIYKNC